MGRGSAGENTVQVAVFERDSGRARCGNVHFHSPVLCLCGCGGRVHLRSVAKRSQGSSTTSQSGLGSGGDRRGFRLATLAAATVHGVLSDSARRENDRLQDGRRQEAEWHARESAWCQGI